MYRYIIAYRNEWGILKYYLTMKHYPSLGFAVMGWAKYASEFKILYGFKIKHR